MLLDNNNIDGVPSYFPALALLSTNHIKIILEKSDAHVNRYELPSETNQ